jgi:hypothetical protein
MSGRFYTATAGVLAACVALVASTSARAAEINGFWLTEDGEAVVEI